MTIELPPNVPDPMTMIAIDWWNNLVPEQQTRWTSDNRLLIELIARLFHDLGIGQGIFLQHVAVIAHQLWSLGDKNNGSPGPKLLKS